MNGGGIECYRVTGVAFVGDNRLITKGETGEMETCDEPTRAVTWTGRPATPNPRAYPIEASAMTDPTSLVAAGDGTADPEDIGIYRAWADESQVSLLLQWEGNGYDEQECWIQAGTDSFYDLDAIV